MDTSLPEIRIRTRVPASELQNKVAKVLTPLDYNILLTGPARVLKPNGQVLCVYRPKALSNQVLEQSYPLLTKIRVHSDNRGAAAASPIVRHGNTTRAVPVLSTVVGYFEAGSRRPNCRLTAWTGHHVDEFVALFPYMQEMASIFKLSVPERFEVQAKRADDTHHSWVITGTPFTTITVNNTYATGVHQDDGDLKEGFSCLGCLRKGDYSGGALVFPEYRLAVDMQHGDALFMDAHEWHGNTDIQKHSADAERISVVLYYRTKIIGCQDPQAEVAKAKLGLANSANDLSKVSSNDKVEA